MTAALRSTTHHHPQRVGTKKQAQHLHTQALAAVRTRRPVPLREIWGLSKRCRPLLSFYFWRAFDLTATFLSFPPFALLPRPRPGLLRVPTAPRDPSCADLCRYVTCRKKSRSATERERQREDRKVILWAFCFCLSVSSTGALATAACSWLPWQCMRARVCACARVCHSGRRPESYSAETKRAGWRVCRFSLSSPLPLSSPSLSPLPLPPACHTPL